MLKFQLSSTVDTLVLQNEKLMADNQLLQSGGKDDGEGNDNNPDHPNVNIDNKAKFQCSKCSKILSSNQKLKAHPIC